MWHLHVLCTVFLLVYVLGDLKGCKPVIRKMHGFSRVLDFRVHRGSTCESVPRRLPEREVWQLH